MPAIEIGGAGDLHAAAAHELAAGVVGICSIRRIRSRRWPRSPMDPLHRFRWRHVLHEVRRSEGPERISAEWWRHDGEPGLTRDYYRVEDEKGAALLAVPRTASTAPGDAALVSASGSSHDPATPSCSATTNFSFLRGRLASRRSWWSARRPRACRAHRHRRPQHAGRRGAAAQRRRKARGYAR